MSKNLLDGPKEYKKDIDNIDKILYKILDDIKKQTIFLSSQNVDRLISLGEVVGDDWEIIENERCDEITFSESDLNLIELAQAPKTSNKKSKQDTSLFKVRYQYAGSKKGERDFCNKVIEADKVYREEDLNANYNYNEELSPSGTDSYNIFLFKGGVNCKHWWQRVVYLKKGNDRISVNQARKMILELDPKDRKEASFDKNDKRVAKVAEAQNNYWSLTPNYRDSGVELSAKSKELYQRLAGFDPSQTRGADGKWGSGGCTFEDWFGNSKIVDSSGKPLEVYHGSTHDFTEFSNVRGNIENDMGIGFYFSSSLDDVTANYDDTDGPDLQGRIERLAERLENDLEVSYEEARKKAEKKLSGGKTNIIKAFISMNNPLTIGGENDTFLDYNYSEEDGESGLLVDFFENYRMAAAGFYDVEPDRVFEGIEIYDGMMASDFVKAIKANEALAYATDEYGNMASNEILRNTFELMGFDGIVDNTVSRFNMDGVNKDTKHIIAFKPNQIKSVKNKSWCREENNINLSSEVSLKTIDGKKAYKTKEEAKKVAKEMGCEGYHEHKVDGVVYYMPCKSHEENDMKLSQETYNDYPQSATNNAKRALKYKEENGSDCGTQVGWTRAGQLARREKLTRDTIARMASFKRHQQHKDVKYSDGCGGIMFDAWGGTSGIEWAIRKLKQIDKK